MLLIEIYCNSNILSMSHFIFLSAKQRISSEIIWCQKYNSAFFTKFRAVFLNLSQKFFCVLTKQNPLFRMQISNVFSQKIETFYFFRLSAREVLCSFLQHFYTHWQTGSSRSAIVCVFWAANSKRFGFVSFSGHSESAESFETRVERRATCVYVY